MSKEKESKERIKNRIQNYVWKLFTRQKLTIEEMGGYSNVSFKNKRR